jgi:anti-sigma factor RsiW
MTTQVKETTACAEMMDSFRLHLEGQLAPERSTELLAHLDSCKACRTEFEAQKRIIDLLAQTYESRRISDNFDQAADRKLNLRRQTPNAELECLSNPDGVEIGAAAVAVEEPAEEAPAQPKTVSSRLAMIPWWFVSVSLHILVIALASLITMAIDTSHSDDSVVMITELAQRVSVPQVEEKKTPVADALDTKHDVPATDLNSKEVSDIVVPPDILAKAELGDHFETINLDRPDTHSAYGVEDAKMFHSVSGNAEAAGGGGMDGLNLDDTIGYGGAASKGKGGGWGGGEGTGIGVNSGGGHGSFGNRTGGGRKLMVKRNGGSPQTEGAVDRGLEWLAKHQEPDGHWDTMKYDAHEKAAGACTKDTLDVGMTGLALLAFLGAGHTEKVGRYKDNVIRGLKWLKQKQDYESGLYCRWNYGHAMAGMAMAEAAGMARVDDTKESAQKAVDATCALKKKYATSERGGWTYVPEQIGAIQGDMSNSGWAMMFIKSAKVAGLKVPAESIDGVNTYLSACERDKHDADGYGGHKYSYGPGPIYADQKNRGYIAILGRLFFGTPANEVEDGTKYMIQLRGLPSSGLVADGAWKDGAGVDLYYDYYMTLITFQVGGDMWQKWNEALKNAIPKIQVKGGDNDGSWDPRGQFSEHWGRVGQTALSILCMEVYYRYAKLSAN